MALIAQTNPSADDLKREEGNATLVVQERPGKYDDGTPFAAGASEAISFTNLAYYRTYPSAPKKIAKGDAAGAAAWLRINAAVNRAVLAKVPASPYWDPKKGPTWPLPTPPSTWLPGSAYAARRPWKKNRPHERNHCGTDLRARAGVPILAPEGGTIVSADSGWEMVKDPKTGKLRGVKALIMTTDSGLTVLLGGVRPGSAKVKKGQRVEAGAVLAEVGNYPMGDSMLHVQLYGRHLTAAELNTRKSWLVGEDPPPDLLDPGDYLNKAATNPRLTTPQTLVGDPHSGADEALVPNDVEGGELNEGTPEGEGTPMAAAAGGRTGAAPCTGDTCQVVDVKAWQAALADELKAAEPARKKAATRKKTTWTSDATAAFAEIDDAKALLAQAKAGELTDAVDFQVAALVSSCISVKAAASTLSAFAAATKAKKSSSGVLVLGGAAMAMAATAAVVVMSRSKKRTRAAELAA